MPHELITIQVGQCGNQIGLAFWELIMNEISQNSQKAPIYDDSISTFFRNIDSKKLDLPIGSNLSDLKARALVVDMECGVIQNKIQGGKLSDLFESMQFITDNPGSGNNFATGHVKFGLLYHEKILDRLRRAAEKCDSLQGFLFLHSLGGGTGSGFGTYILKCVADEYPNLYRFSNCVLQSSDKSDVNVGPYNSMLSINQLIDHADCVLPVDNESLFQITNWIDAKENKNKNQKQNNTKQDKAIVPNSAITEVMGKKDKEYNKENSIIAHLLSNLTSSMRYEGYLNIDINEITMNLVPFPKLHFLQSSITPLYSLMNKSFQARNKEQMFDEVLSPNNQLLNSDMKNSCHLACALMARGDITISELNSNVDKLRQKIKMPIWNQDGFKTGLCSKPPYNQKHSLLFLSNNTGIAQILENISVQFHRLFSKKVFVHHFLNEGLELDEFKRCEEQLEFITNEYKKLSSSNEIKEIGSSNIIL